MTSKLHSAEAMYSIWLSLCCRLQVMKWICFRQQQDEMLFKLTQTLLVGEPGSNGQGVPGVRLGRIRSPLHLLFAISKSPLCLLWMLGRRYCLLLHVKHANLQTTYQCSTTGNTLASSLPPGNFSAECLQAQPLRYHSFLLAIMECPLKSVLEGMYRGCPVGKD